MSDFDNGSIVLPFFDPIESCSTTYSL